MLTADGRLQMTVTGPASESRVLAVGMIEMGKSLLLNQPQAKPSAIIPAVLVPNGAHR